MYTSKGPKSISGLWTRNHMAETRASCCLIDLSPRCVAHTIWSLRMAAMNRRTELAGVLQKMPCGQLKAEGVHLIFTSLLCKFNSWTKPYSPLRTGHRRLPSGGPGTNPPSEQHQVCSPRRHDCLVSVPGTKQRGRNPQTPPELRVFAQKMKDVHTASTKCNLNGG